MDWQNLGVSVARLALAATVGGLIGFERESHGQAAGLRTFLLVCLGACLMMLLSLNMADLHAALPGTTSVVQVDPSRIASYAIASMGFLGAGAIITGIGSVRGLTTAAGLWLVTGIGLAIGAGFLLPALFTALVSLTSLYILRQLKDKFRHDTFTTLTLKFSGRLGKHLEAVRRVLDPHEVNIAFVNYQRVIPENLVVYRLRLECKENAPWGRLVRELSEIPELREMSWQEGEVP